MSLMLFSFPFISANSNNVFSPAIDVIYNSIFSSIVGAFLSLSLLSDIFIHLLLFFLFQDIFLYTGPIDD